MMKSLSLSILLAATGSLAIPETIQLDRRAVCTSPVSITGNPFATRTLHPPTRYAKEVAAASDAISDPVLKAKALKVASVGTFLWLCVHPFQ
jgi:cellulose 1,4-beta-cellobiosidase